MKKIALVTLYGNSNFGNKLQNFAIQYKLEKMNIDVTTLRTFNSNIKYLKKIFNRIKYFIKKIYPYKLYRNNNFKNFEKKFLKNSKRIYFSNEDNSGLNSKYDFFIVGSDQVWNPACGLKGNLKLLKFTQNRISFSASFSVDDISQKEKKEFKKELRNFKKISVREDQGKNIIKNIDEALKVEVLIDPTMLLDSKEWNKLANKPKQLDSIKNGKYILNYFLGELSEKRKKEIERIAKENNCTIINILNESDPFYTSGPSEFLYLEKNAFLICTDSFHSSVFAIIFNRPFIVFDREQNGIKLMGSRIDTLLSKFKLEKRRFNGEKITKENLKHDYTEAYKILEEERNKSEKFLKKALDIE